MTIDCIATRGSHKLLLSLILITYTVLLFPISNIGTQILCIASHIEVGICTTDSATPKVCPGIGSNEFVNRKEGEWKLRQLSSKCRWPYPNPIAGTEDQQITGQREDTTQRATGERDLHRIFVKVSQAAPKHKRRMHQTGSSRSSNPETGEVHAIYEEDYILHRTKNTEP